jgi:hypothetical protein
MLKGKVSINVGNSSEDGVYKFIVVWCIEGGNFCKVWCLSGTFWFSYFRRPENSDELYCVKMG